MPPGQQSSDGWGLARDSSPALPARLGPKALLPWLPTGRLTEKKKAQSAADGIHKPIYRNTATGKFHINPPPSKNKAFFFFGGWLVVTTCISSDMR